MKKAVAVTSLGLLVALSPLAYAQDDSSFYLGARTGISSLEDACEVGSCDDKEPAGGVILGYDFANGFAIESTYDYLGRFDANTNATGATSAGDLTTLTLAPKFNIGITDQTDIYAKLGAAWWNWNSGAGDLDDVSLLTAVGVDHRATDLVNLRLEYQYLPDMNDGYLDVDNHLISAGVTFHFGRSSEPAPEPVVVVEEVVVAEVVETKKYVFSEADEVELFAFGKGELSSQAAQALNPMLKRLQDFEESTAVIIGHTDSVGSEAFNQKLSEQRAQSVADYFTSNGVSADRLSVVGEGESNPVASNDTEDGRAKNRRVEIESPEFVYEE
ncbi:OmpA family protein [Enterovibrio norvegicus]|uniref:OmpA family protein n=1 Tax=Enterovibrio norvegicus TaxID=188144 RepID=UPI000C839A0C|nr:OmpA family protein [Enterovibrio norvegicus]PMH71607.1 hypothetical protein BCU62_05120 [Enterovibrio norvegicus]TKF29325.1 OmpA family protein [Enterovibrio norvegicus]